MRLSLPILILALAGCSFGPEPEYEIRASQIPEGIGRYRSVAVEVTTQDAELYEGVEPLKSALVGRLAALSVFDRFMTGVEARRADVQIAVQLIAARGVSSAERVLLGGLAEKPRVTAEVCLIDLRTGAQVGRFQADGMISGGSPTGYTTPEAYENAGAGIAEYLHSKEGAR